MYGEGLAKTYFRNTPATYCWEGVNVDEFVVALGHALQCNVATLTGVTCERKLFFLKEKTGIDPL